MDRRNHEIGRALDVVDIPGLLLSLFLAGAALLAASAPSRRVPGTGSPSVA